MQEQRWPWLVAASVMLVAAAATIWSTYLHWLPCRGSMFNGSIVRGYDYGTGFSDACLRRMDGGLPFPHPPEPAEQTPWASELGVAATALAALAWLILILGLRWSWPTKAVAALPGLATLVIVAVAAIALGDATRNPDDYLPLRLWVTIDVSAVIAAAVIWSRQPDIRGPRFLRLLLVLWGTTAFGFFHAATGYAAMITFSDANWDVPPGTGYLTGAVLLVSVILTVVMTLLPALTAAGAPSSPNRMLASPSDAPAGTSTP